MPKKTKTEAITDQNMASPEGKPSKTKPGRKPAGSRVAKKASSKKAGARRNTKAGKKAAPMTEPSDEEISIRAYFISERRRRFGLPGDASSDWLEAKKQLLSETGPR